MNLKASTNVASINILDVDHHRALERALKRIIYTDLAEDTYAEVLDGMPMATSYRDFFYSWKSHPSVNHPALCPGSRERARAFRATFDITSLGFSLITLLAFQESAPSSKQFYLRLLELLAASCHQIAVYLYEITPSNYHHAEHEKWRDEPHDLNVWDYRPPIAFTHGPYKAVEQYPHGFADVAAYWVEARIFGGVMVFDRGETETECREVYIHACRKFSPSTIFPPTQKQFDQLIHFLLSDDLGAESGSAASCPTPPAVACPLPIIPTKENRWRWDPWEAYVHFHIFRDRYERRVSATKPLRSNPISHDWPEIEDELLLVNWLYRRRSGEPVDEEKIDKLRRTVKMITPTSPIWGKEKDWSSFDE